MNFKNARMKLFFILAYLILIAPAAASAALFPLESPSSLLAEKNSDMLIDTGLILLPISWNLKDFSFFEFRVQSPVRNNSSSLSTIDQILSRIPGFQTDLPASETTASESTVEAALKDLHPESEHNLVLRLQLGQIDFMQAFIEMSMKKITNASRDNMSEAYRHFKYVLNHGLEGRVDAAFERMTLSQWIASKPDRTTFQYLKQSLLQSRGSSLRMTQAVTPLLEGHR